jgi:1,4-alpha-glucan branching enzyme
MAAKTRLVKIKFKPTMDCRDVKIAGDFTEWQNGAIVMSKSSRSGEWTASVRVAPGEYQYRFMIDGNWYTDPSTERSTNPFGSDNSILRVS